MDLEFPRLLYRVGTQWTLESGSYDLLQVADQAAHDAAIADGWHVDQYAAKAAEEPQPVSDAPPTRAELEQKATELGIKFDGRTSDRKLSEAIAAKLGA